MRLMQSYKKVLKIFSFVIINLFLISCNLFAKENVPYVVNGEFSIDNANCDFEIGGVNLYFFNKKEKPIKNFTVVFFLFDEDGEPVNVNKNSLVFNVEQYVGANESIDFCLDLDDYIFFEPNDSWFIDYLYVSEIVYEDGYVWLDPFGLNVF